MPTRHGVRSRKYGSVDVAPWSRPEACRRGRRPRTARPRRQADGTGIARRIDEGAAVEADLQREAAFRRRRRQAMRGAAAHALRRRAAAASAAADSCASGGRAARSSAALARMAAQDDKAAIVVDHAEAGNQADARIGHLRRPGDAEQLAHRLDQAEIAAGRAGLPDRKLAAGGVVRERAVVGEVVLRARSPAPRPSCRSRDPRTASSR